MGKRRENEEENSTLVKGPEAVGAVSVNSTLIGESPVFTNRAY